MKKILFAGLLLSAGVLSAQTNQDHKYSIENNIVKATYYYENGTVKQEGSYKDGKLHGNWTAYNEDGTKQSMGEYADGKKTGKWFFWTGAVLNEVDFQNSRIAEVKKWSKDAVVINK
jgi:antitoxin component YwqK of YwqJK toxin-antitoxin module